MLVHLVMDMSGFDTGKRLTVYHALNVCFFEDELTWLNVLGPIQNGINGFGQVFVMAAAYYVGTEIVSVAAGESKNPQRDVPRVSPKKQYGAL